MSAPVLITGAAGFIGFSLARRLLEDGRAVIGVDSLDRYYDPALKNARVAVLRQFRDFSFQQLNLADRPAAETLFRAEGFEVVVHLAAQAGVRHSVENPHAYVEANFSGFLNVLEGCRQRRTPHLIYASSSSVYGAGTRMPFSVEQSVDHPLSLYAASKKANELMAHAYSHLYGLPATGLRFFTVYGPWGRPDMAMFIFTRAILAGEPIRLFNHGRMRRDFTYVDDVVEALARVIDRPPAGNPRWSGDAPDPASSSAPWRIYNIGNNRAVDVARVVDLLESELGRKAVRTLLPMQMGDVPETCADAADFSRDFDFKPRTTIEQGVRQFVAWYRDHYGVA